ncbi:MAG: DUF2996 domain-containing protein [Cyanobacteria bacterium RU_5_0]|nr:DUF2996 domain-containing protein [Cyanobacteria bacterium RU_5_0]
MSDETTPKPPETETPVAEAKPAKAKADAAEGEAKLAKAPREKKEKAPALEDKPFRDFITQDYLPALTQALAKLGIQDLDLKFEKRPFPIPELGDSDYWQVVGHWQSGQREFIILFSKEDIQAPKFFCCADKGAKPSILESFMIDERKISLDLLVSYTVQRLNGQKWLQRN